MELTMRLTGTRPMLMHNGRLANPIDPWTRKLGLLTKKRQKTDDDLIDIMRTEARGSCWETADGLLGVPGAAIWRSLYDAAKAFKQGENVKRALMFEDVTIPLMVEGRPYTADEWITDPAHIDYRPVAVQRAKTMRARPLIPVGWSVELTVELMDDVMDARQMVPIFERAGRLVGLGDWRPTYGRYEISIE